MNELLTYSYGLPRNHKLSQIQNAAHSFSNNTTILQQYYNVTGYIYSSTVPKYDFRYYYFSPLHLFDNCSYYLLCILRFYKDKLIIHLNKTLTSWNEDVHLQVACLFIKFRTFPLNSAVNTCNDEEQSG